MSTLLLYTLLIVIVAVSCVLGALASAFSFALASFRFSGIDKKRSENTPEEKLNNAAKFFVAHSEKVGATVSMIRRSLYACEIFCATALACILILGGIDLKDTLSCFLIFIIISGGFLIMQYAFFDFPFAIYGKHNPTKTLNFLAKPFYAAYFLYAPLEFLARKFGAKILGKKIYAKNNVFDYLDVEVMLRAQNAETDVISPYTGKILNNALRLNELDVSDVMLPRSQVVYFDTDSSNAENIAIAERTQHTRYPLCRDNLDNCFGIIHIKDIFMRSAEIDKIDLMQIRRETIRLRENDKLETALLKLLKYKLHMAIVEDEFGGTIGVMTLDAALSQLVGKIRDEFDTRPDQSIQALGKNRYKILGQASLHRVEDFLDVDFKTDEVSTFGGLITLRIGRFPENGERLYFKEQRLRITIDRVEERMIGECTVQIEETDLLV